MGGSNVVSGVVHCGIVKASAGKGSSLVEENSETEKCATVCSGYIYSKNWRLMRVVSLNGPAFLFFAAR